MPELKVFNVFAITEHARKAQRTLALSVLTHNVVQAGTLVVDDSKSIVKRTLNFPLIITASIADKRTFIQNKLLHTELPTWSRRHIKHLGTCRSACACSHRPLVHMYTSSAASASYMRLRP